MQEAARGVSAMFRIAVCDENTMVRKKMKQLAAAYMESRECKAEIYEAACEQEVPAKVHAILNYDNWWKTNCSNNSIVKIF